MKKLSITTRNTGRCTELKFDPANPLLSIYPENTIVQKDTYALMFIAALFTIARTRKQPRCPSADEWIKKF